MICLEAVCIGYAVPRRAFDAQVHSAFASAANLCLSKGNRLLTLLTVGQADLPQGMRLNTPPGFLFEKLHPGESISCRNGLLHCEQASLTIDLRPARRWKCDLASLAVDLRDPITIAAWRSVEQMLKERRSREISGWAASQIATVRRMGEIVPELLTTTGRYDLLAFNSVARLIGLGSGLTPTGDDFLVGYLAGLWCATRGKKERLQFLSSLGKAVICLSRQTNDISQTYLFHAVRGQVSSRLEALAEAICRGEQPDRLRTAADAAMQVGHTSGMDAVSGLLLGLSAWAGGPVAENGLSPVLIR
jgi:hypothetical protein